MVLVQNKVDLMHQACPIDLLAGHLCCMSFVTLRRDQAVVETCILHFDMHIT